ncbi:hypothetical protein SARC_16506, partial [Sphaeroforma arctica JP610]
MLFHLNPNSFGPDTKFWIQSDQIGAAEQKDLRKQLQSENANIKVLFTACTDNKNDRALRTMLSKTVKTLLDRKIVEQEVRAKELKDERPKPREKEKRHEKK